MTRRLALMLIAALALTPVASSLAKTSTSVQEAQGGQGGGTPAADSLIEVTVGEYVYPLNPAYPVNYCVIERTEDQRGGFTIRYRLFVREESADGPFFNQVGIFEDSGAGFASTEVNDCLPMNGIVNG